MSFTIGPFRVYLGVPREGWIWGYDAWYHGHNDTLIECWGLGPLFQVGRVLELS